MSVRKTKCVLHIGRQEQAVLEINVTTRRKTSVEIACHIRSLKTDPVVAHEVGSTEGEPHVVSWTVRRGLDDDVVSHCITHGGGNGHTRRENIQEGRRITCSEVP